MSVWIHRGALHGSALCVSGALRAATLCTLLCCLSLPAQAGSCSATERLEKAAVRKVLDGDTVLLDNGNKLRLIGINTPEAEHKDKKRRHMIIPAEPLADRATNLLKHELEKVNYRVAIQIGRDRRDRHSRLLGHLFTRDGRNLTARLLRRGMGFHIAIPPNLKLLDCYQRAEQHARKKKRGIWGNDYFRARNSLRIPDKDSGFIHVGGKVTRLGRSRRAHYLDLPGAVSIKIDRRDLHYFKKPLDKLVGTRITARGWSYRNKNKLYIRVRHPAAISTSP